jgi:SAM-dependent methyltransferase
MNVDVRDIPLFLPNGLRDIGDSDPIRLYRWPFLGGLYRQRVQLCLSELRGGKRVLEVGYGSGVSFLELARRYEQVCGLDLHPAPKSLRQALRDGGLTPELRQGSVLEMPYDSQLFDAVLLVSILEHLKPAELRRAFDEIRRVLVPGGQLVYGVPIDRRLMTVAFGALGVSIRDHHFSSHRDIAAAASRCFTPVALRQLRALGGRIGAVYEVGSFVRQ